MKRLFCFLLCFIMLFSFTACKDKKAPAPEETSAVSSQPVLLEYDLGSKEPHQDLQLVDASGNVWFTASEIELIGSRYHKEIGRYLEIILTKTAKQKIAQATEKEKTTFTAVIGEETYATFKTHTKDDGTVIIIYVDKKDPIMDCYNAIT